MPGRYLEYYTKMSLLEIVTICSNEDAREIHKKVITGVQYKKAYSKKLEAINKFSDIDWSKHPYSNFKVLKDNPPKKLLDNDGKLQFDGLIEVTNWDDFIDSFRQVRNNLTHGAKYFKGDGAKLGLDERDEELINAALAFIEFLQMSGIVKDNLYLPYAP